MIELQGSSILIHGHPKVGKTQLAASFPKGVLFIATEQGHRYIPRGCKVFSMTEGYKGWQQFRNLLSDGKLMNPKIKTVVIDTTGKFYDRCFYWVCKENGWKHPTDRAGGGGWDAIRAELIKQTGKLAEQLEKSGQTTIFIAHTTVQELDLGYTTYNKIVPSFGKQCRDVILPNVDHVWYLGYSSHDSEGISGSGVDTVQASGDDRSLWVAGRESIEAGTRDPEITLPRGVIENLPKFGQYDYILKELNND